MIKCKWKYLVSTFFVGEFMKIGVDKRNKIILCVTLYLLLFVIVFGVSNAKVFGSSLVPFGVGIVFSLIFINLNGYVMSIIYILAYSLAGMSWSCLFESLNVACVLSFLFYLINKKKIKVKKWMLFVFAILSQIAFIITHLGSSKENLVVLIILIISMLFMYSCCVLCESVKDRYVTHMFTIDEKICGSVMLIIFVYGLSSTNISIINLGLVFCTLLILICTYLTSGGTVLIISSLMGVSYALCMQSSICISLFVIMALLSIAFKSSCKYICAIAVTIGYLIFMLMFRVGFSYGEIISCVIGCVIFCIVPMSLINRFKYVFDNKYNVTVRNILSNTKNQIIKRVQELSNIFNEMDKVYRDMVRGVLADDKAVCMLKEELVGSVCAKCKNYDLCFRGSMGFMDNSLDTITNVAYTRGKILLIDLPQYLSSNCIKVNEIMCVINDMVESYKEYTTAINNLDSSRLLIADQLGGVSKLLGTLSKEVDVNINFDSKYDEKIKEELMFKNIVCLDVVIYEKDIQTKNVNLVIKTESIKEKIIEKIVSKIVNVKLQIAEIVPADIPNCSLLKLIPKANYDVAYGCSTITKSGKMFCGDSKLMLKIDDGKYMVSICDGMGSGRDAYNISSLTISLIEKFYLAGFDNQTILNSVNKLLSITEQEKFSTIDLCVIDTKKNTYDFIKLGATSGYLKRDKGECEIIESSGLPVGVLEEIRPHIIKKIISPFDMLVFVSDGITDSFEGKIELAEYIRNDDIINPQTLSKDILNKALELNGGVALDDMTVICVRVFSNY